MPIYAYKCESCGHQQDVLQKVSDPVLTDCPACGRPALVKQITAAGFQLKGSGWYVTDFRNNGGPAAAKKDAAGAPAPAADAPAPPAGAAAPAASPAPAPATPSPAPAAGGSSSGSAS
jgi:putative FmdB family regulatory protein